MSAVPSGKVVSCRTRSSPGWKRVLKGVVPQFRLHPPHRLHAFRVLTSPTTGFSISRSDSTLQPVFDDSRRDPPPRWRNPASPFVTTAPAATTAPVPTRVQAEVIVTLSPSHASCPTAHELKGMGSSLAWPRAGSKERMHGKPTRWMVSEQYFHVVSHNNVSAYGDSPGSAPGIMHVP